MNVDPAGTARVKVCMIPREEIERSLALGVRRFQAAEYVLKDEVWKFDVWGFVEYPGHATDHVKDEPSGTQPAC